LSYYQKYRQQKKHNMPLFDNEYKLEGKTGEKYKFAWYYSVKIDN